MTLPVAEPLQPERVAPGDGRAEQGHPDGDVRVSQLNEPLIPLSGGGPPLTMELPGDAVFVAGLDALIRGFISD